MKLLANKTFPHPVLWNQADDYVNRAFQLTRDFVISKDNIPSIAFKFTVNEESIRELIRDNKAAYALEIHCPMTLFRCVFKTQEESGKISLDKGALFADVDVNAFVVCTAEVKNHASKNFNGEFGENASFDLQPGDVLAADGAFSYYWSTELAKPIHSVIDLVANHTVVAGQFSVDTSGDKVKIQMNPSDKSKFEAMRGNSNYKPIAMLVYLTAIIEVLQQMKIDDAESGKRWYRVFAHHFEDKDLSNIDPFMITQKLMRNPLGTMLTHLERIK